MNYQGFYPCAVAGAVDRIFGLNQAIVDLADVSEAAMINKYQVFCQLCGYYRPIRENSQTLLSPAWRVAVNHYLMAARQSPTSIPPNPTIWTTGRRSASLLTFSG